MTAKTKLKTYRRHNCLKAWLHLIDPLDRNNDRGPEQLPVVTHIKPDTLHIGIGKQ